MNGELLKAAEQGRFEALLTTDKNMDAQQNLKTRAIAASRRLITDDGNWSLSGAPVSARGNNPMGRYPAEHFQFRAAKNSAATSATARCFPSTS